ncbi:shikimate dehydrogenase [Candidatus Roizmanbacteria bacterium]|nr:MAG: shikimate dehydrogenase [Candidatus Roizmanbacteria bacterium]
MNISGKTKICVIIGDPVEHSLSPAMHNAAYEALGIDDEFVFVAARVNLEDVKDVVQAVRVMNIRVLTCTIPHKMEVMKYLDEIDPIAEKIGAVNTVVNDKGVLKGYNTDWLGTVIPLENHAGDLRGTSVALVGAGGAARAMAYGVLEKGAKLSVFNRNQKKAQILAKELDSDVSVFTYDDMSREIPKHEIILNATSLGMGEQIDQTPLQKEYLRKGHIVFDAVYKPRETRLLKEAKEQGAVTVQGVEMLLHQGTAQFELYTGRKAPIEVMRKVLQ